jgi:hypothetical protein
MRLFSGGRRARPMVCILLSSPRMPPALRRRRTHRERLDSRGAAFLMATVLLGAAAPARAQDVVSPYPHVRPDTNDGREFVDEAMHRSRAVRELIDRLNESDVTVYLRFRAFSEIRLDGRVRFLAATASQRYLLIELACVRPRVTQVATFGHELFHALEIAAAPSIVDAATLAAHYERVGMRVGESSDARMYETRAARDMATRVVREVFTPEERTAYGKRPADSPRP